jgi:DNA polymerase IV (archaeal DinB-like DNA polymerase)
MDILRGHASLIEQASVDEAYFDVSNTGSYERAREVAQAVKAEIRAKERLTASVGVGPNKLIAKIASDAQKPDGLTLVRAEDAEAFLAPMNIRVIPGVGPKTEEQFRKLGIRTIGDARKLSREKLTDMMGKHGASLYERLRGRDETPLVAEREAKSIGRHETFVKDIPATDRVTERKFLEGTLATLADDVHWHLVAEVRAGASFTSFRKITITVRFADFTTMTRTTTLAAPVPALRPDGTANPAALETLRFQALRLFMPFLDRRENPARKAFRLLGVSIGELE